MRLYKNRRKPILAAVLACLWVMPSSSQEYWAVGCGLDSRVRTYRVTASGEAAVHQDFAPGGILDSNILGVESAGRFVWLSQNFEGPVPSPIYRILDDYSLVPGGEVIASSPEWEITKPTLITPDTSELFVQSLAPGIGDFRTALEFQSLNNSLVTAVTDSVWDTTNVLEAQLSVASISTFDRYTLHAGRRIVRYDPALRSFQLTPQTSDFTNGVGRASIDGRFFFITEVEGPDIGVNELLGDGLSTLTIVDELDIPSFSSGAVLAVHSNGRFVYVMGSGIAVIEIDPATGLIVRVVEVQGAPSSNDMTISHDGRMLFQCTNRFGGIARMIPYRVNDDGSLDPLNNGLEVPFSTSDLAFLPPKPAVTLAGDANVDGRVDAADVVTVLDMARPTARLAPAQNFVNADLDHDVDVDQADFAELLDLLLGN